MDVDDTTEALISHGTGILVVAITVATFHNYPRSQGKNIKSHIAFFMVAAAVLFFVPDYIQNVIFSQGGVLVIGTIVPIYESIRAVCTIEEADDTAWLQYWISSGKSTLIRTKSSPELFLLMMQVYIFLLHTSNFRNFYILH